MAKKNIIKNDTSINWSKATFIPKEGEIILYTDLLKIKIGDGKTKINDLKFNNDLDYSLFNGEFNVEEEK